jgi:hypothetical protein
MVAEPLTNEHAILALLDVTPIKKLTSLDVIK